MSGPDKGQDELLPKVEVETVEDLEAANSDEAVLGGASPSLGRNPC